MSGWDEIAATALLGTARRALPAEPLPAELRQLAGSGGSDASAQLLDVAALATAYRRAGMRLRPPRELPAPAAHEGRPVVPAAARARLTELLALNDIDLLFQWLRLATARGLAPPPAALPGLLAHAKDRERLPELVAAVGPRGVWLAGFRPHWRDRIAPASEPGQGQSWALADRAQRRQWLIELGASHPGTARASLGTGWADRFAVDRPELVIVLRQAISENDEDFLEECLDDGRKPVRAAAAGMLSLLPGSAFAARATARAKTIVRVEGRLRRRIVVHPPESLDDAMRRDGIAAPGPDVDARAWLVTQIVQSVPLRTWPPDAPDLPVEERWAGTLWHAWLEAAAWERDADWAARLIPHEPRSSAATATRAGGRTGGRTAFVARLLTAIPAPWPRDLSVIVLGWLQAQGEHPYEVRTVLDLAARRLPTEAAGRMDAVGRRFAPESQSRYAFTRATQLMLYRRTMFEELQ